MDKKEVEAIPGLGAPVEGEEGLVVSEVQASPEKEVLHVLRKQARVKGPSDQRSEQRATIDTLDVINDEHHICVALAPVLS